MLKVILIKRLFDNLKCVSNTRNSYFDDLPYDCDQSLITGWLIRIITKNIMEGLKIFR